MRVYTVDHTIVEVLDVAFSKQNYDWLLDTQARFPNLPLRTGVLKGGKTVEVYIKVHSLNLEKYESILMLNPQG